MNKKFLILSLFVLAGCSYGQEKLETYIEEPGYFIKDPHFAQYQEGLDALERDYLEKKITYAQYLEQKQALDEQYEKEIQQRDAVIIPQK